MSLMLLGGPCWFQEDIELHWVSVLIFFEGKVTDLISQQGTGKNAIDKDKDNTLWWYKYRP